MPHLNPHVHRLEDGSETGVRIDVGNGTQHFHMVNGQRTSTDDASDGHQHVFNDKITSGPESAKQPSLEEALARRRAGANQG